MATRLYRGGEGDIHNVAAAFTKIYKVIPPSRQQRLIYRKKRNSSPRMVPVAPDEETTHDLEPISEPISEPGANFFVGQRKIYLPDFQICLMRTPQLPPSQAQFRVPLHFTKLDIRDYLYHAYNVRIHGVRVEIQGPKIDPRKKNPDARALEPMIKARGERKPKPLSKRLRKEAKEMDEQAEQSWDEAEVKKMMIVDLEEPFVWPAMPTEADLDQIAGPGLAEQRKRVKKQEEMRKTLMKYSGVDVEGKKRTEELLAKQAKALIEYKAAWGGATVVEEENRSGRRAKMVS